ncbi:S-adenosyl-L-methionine-dependent methyltransferase [Venustampulla echinocandica]|uniref:S-adenosyl-L-methionine-dependent methyltransferase n=1 Tax=Venustampulla echinocandica TaxID=2656787 RepID=A0A370TEH8_9HELO|nr:S-adenosyl-L-methionine-dependent methyltransferase [Venustampulla echinocandica]RDL33095.1 S-adenosyl-L-methionine-dependent methyltransferase [Venustampulla echinocandica]
MASLIPNILPRDPHSQIFIVGASLVVLIGFIFASTFRFSKKVDEGPGGLASFLRFFYASFLKPHTGDGTGNGQQDALESFYKAQAGVYDATRKRLLRGREDMLGLVAAQLVHKAGNERTQDTKRIWVDIGGGTGWNIEAMSGFVSVPEFFSSVYLVDFSPSLCEVARKRFARLGWTNVKVVCQDARTFRLEDHENGASDAVGYAASTNPSYFAEKTGSVGGADLVTLSYSLSMIPDFYSVIDSLSALLAPSGTIGVVDFYVQSIVDLSCRNYTGGAINRHVNWFGRLFWRAWFDVDRVGLEAGRRDYLEYRFGTVLSADSRNYLLGSIPYYVWLGCSKRPDASLSTPNYPHEIVERIDAAVTESPYLSPINHTQTLSRTVERSTPPEIRSKAFDAAIINLSANLPLPSFFYQNHHWRIHYDDQLKKHTQFKHEYIYAFTWEDSRVDYRLLKLGPHDVVLAITSAGDNILSYALSSPARIHAVDLNPNQNHLLELKVAAYSALPYADFWKLFGLGKHPNFRSLLISRLSPHMSSRAFQYWLNNTDVFMSARGKGLYETGGSRHAIRIVRLLSTALGFRGQIKRLLEAKTLNEQREIWTKRIRPLIMSRVLSYLVVSQEKFLWAALGVPHNQLAMLEADHIAAESIPGAPSPSSPLGHSEKELNSSRGQAVWEYMVQTLDPVIESSIIGEDNPYYLVCLQGAYSQRCHPDYLKPKSHQKLSRPGAFDGLRIHTDEINEVVNRLTPGTLTVAVVMDSMDWFDPGAEAANTQISKLNRALKLGGRVLLRSAALTPWYIAAFEEHGFTSKRVGARIGGACIDRVNMYASCYILTKIENLAQPTSRTPSRENSVDLETLEI